MSRSAPPPGALREPSPAAPTHAPRRSPGALREPSPATSTRAPRRLRAEILVFLTSGAVAAGCNIVVGAAVRSAFGVGAHTLAVIAGFVVGTVVSFLMNRELTFRARRDRVSVQATKFILLAVTGVALAAAIAELALQAGTILSNANTPSQTLANIAHVIAIGSTTLYNYLGMKYFALRQ